MVPSIFDPLVKTAALSTTEKMTTELKLTGPMLVFTKPHAWLKTADKMITQRRPYKDCWGQHDVELNMVRFAQIVPASNDWTSAWMSPSEIIKHVIPRGVFPVMTSAMAHETTIVKTQETFHMVVTKMMTYGVTSQNEAARLAPNASFRVKLWTEQDVSYPLPGKDYFKTEETLSPNRPLTAAPPETNPSLANLAQVVQQVLTESTLAGTVATNSRNLITKASKEHVEAHARAHTAKIHAQTQRVEEARRSDMNIDHDEFDRTWEREKSPGRQRDKPKRTEDPKWEIQKKKKSAKRGEKTGTADPTAPEPQKAKPAQEQAPATAPASNTSTLPQGVDTTIYLAIEHEDMVVVPVPWDMLKEWASKDLDSINSKNLNLKTITRFLVHSGLISMNLGTPNSHLRAAVGMGIDFEIWVEPVIVLGNTTLKRRVLANNLELLWMTIAASQETPVLTFKAVSAKTKDKNLAMKPEIDTSEDSEEDYEPLASVITKAGKAAHAADEDSEIEPGEILETEPPSSGADPEDATGTQDPDNVPMEEAQITETPVPQGNGPQSGEPEYQDTSGPIDPSVEASFQQIEAEINQQIALEQSMAVDEEDDGQKSPKKSRHATPARED